MFRTTKRKRLSSGIGVDMGLVAIAQTSDGTRFAGSTVNSKRARNARQRHAHFFRSSVPAPDAKNVARRIGVLSVVIPRTVTVTSLDDGTTGISPSPVVILRISARSLVQWKRGRAVVPRSLGCHTAFPRGHCYIVSHSYFVCFTPLCESAWP